MCFEISFDIEICETSVRQHVAKFHGIEITLYPEKNEITIFEIALSRDSVLPNALLVFRLTIPWFEI